MSAKQAKKRSFWERYAHRQLSELTSSQSGEQLFLLSQEEITQLRKIRRNTYIKAGMAGMMGIALLYIPYHIWGEALFPKRAVWIPFYHDSPQLELEFLVYSLVLVFVEIWYLTYLNIHAVKAIASTCGSPDPSDENYNEHLDDLISVGLDKKQKNSEQFGINPFEGLSKWSVAIFQIMVKLKATLSGFLFKIIISRILGRYAFRMLVDLLGGPLYAFWNILGARKVMNEARVRVMAPPLIYAFVDYFHTHFKDDESVKDAIFPSLQKIASSKRSFHYNHYLLAKSLFNQFELSPEAIAEKTPELRIETLSQEGKKAIAKLIIFGIIIDGKLSFIERKTLKRLQEEGFITQTIDEVKQWSNDYFQGKGLNDFFLS